MSTLTLKSVVKTEDFQKWVEASPLRTKLFNQSRHPNTKVAEVAEVAEVVEVVEVAEVAEVVEDKQVTDTLIFSREFFTQPVSTTQATTVSAFGYRDKEVFVEGFGESRFHKPKSNYSVTQDRLRVYLKKHSDKEVVGLTPRRLSEILLPVIDNWRMEARDKHRDNADAYTNDLHFKRKALDSIISPLFKQQAQSIKGTDAHEQAVSWDDEIANLQKEFGFGLYPTAQVGRSNGYPVYDQCSMVDCLRENANGLSKRNANDQWVNNDDRYEAHETLEAISF